MTRTLLLALSFAILVLAAACSSNPQAASPDAQAQTNPKPPASPTVPAIANSQAEVKPWRVNGDRAFQYVRDVVDIGPRKLGSPGHKRVEEYLRRHLKSYNLEEDVFTAATPVGQFGMRNFIAKFPGKKDDIIVVAGHYDTNCPLPNTFVGANDGGSSTGLLLELAAQLHQGINKTGAASPRQGYSVWLVWLDGEEAVKQWTATDSLYGSRHLAEKWQADGTLKKIKAFVLLDMVGDADLNIDRDTNSTPWLQDVIHRAATRLGYGSFFFRRQGSIEDDHIPFMRHGVPCVDLIDFEYGYNNVFWHTPEDTMDKLSSNSLEIVGSTVLTAIELLDEQ